MKSTDKNIQNQIEQLKRKLVNEMGMELPLSTDITNQDEDENKEIDDK